MGTAVKLLHVGANWGWVDPTLKCPVLRVAFNCELPATLLAPWLRRKRAQTVAAFVAQLRG
eukprot:6510415-Lingulodinium_polyedra.AAC.1